MIDWKKIRADYVSGKYSYDSLAEKHGVSRTAIVNHSRKENWTKKKSQVENSHITNVARSCIESDRKYTDKVYKVADKILDMAENLADKMVSDETVTAKDMKVLSDVVKNIREIKGIKSDMDTKEQLARIKKLEKEIATDVEAPQVNITIHGADDGWLK